MQSQSVIAILLLVISLSGQHARVIDSQDRLAKLKVFNYQGPLQIKDDRTGEIVKSDDDDLISVVDTSTNQTIDEAACWKLIVDQSG